MLPWGDASDMMRHQSGKGGCNKTSGEEVFNMGGSNEGSKTIRGAVLNKIGYSLEIKRRENEC